MNEKPFARSKAASDSGKPVRLRRIAVGIERSAFHPLEIPAMIEERFDQVLATASVISDPFEQAFFAKVQLSYLLTGR